MSDNWSNAWNDDKYKEKGFEGTWANSPKPASNNPWDTLNQDELILLHKQKQEALSALKQEELELRKYIVDRAFPNKEEGTNTLELGKGYELKAVVKYNYKLDDNNKVEAGLAKIAATGNQGAFIADRLVGWTPNFYVSEYRKLQEDAEAGSPEAKAILKIIPEFLTITEAAPTLTIKEPKVKK